MFRCLKTIHAFAIIFLLFFGILTGNAQSLSTNVKFDFGAVKTAAGYTRVLATDLYDTTKGYGFDFGTLPIAVDRGGADAIKSDFITRDAPFYFSVSLPEGNYNVTVTMGDLKGKTSTTLKAESRRLLLNKLETAPGVFVTKTFTINIKNRQINATEKVGLKPREMNKLDWDDKLTLEFNGSRPCINAVEISKVTDAVTVFLAGNSTVVDQDDEPWASWGQMIPMYFKPGVAISNHAESGLTLGSFLGSKRLQKILSVMKPGDYLFIEFGHNDQKDKGADDGAYKSYKTRLELFITETRKKQGIPVLVTPTNRRTFDENGLITNSLGDFPDAVRLVAKEQNVPLIDLNNMTRQLFEALGPEKSKLAFVHYPAGTFPGQDTELKDNTHFNSYGAFEIANCVVSGIIKLNLGLAKSITALPLGFTPSTPLQPDKWELAPSPKSTFVKPDGN